MRNKTLIIIGIILFSPLVIFAGGQWEGKYVYAIQGYRIGEKGHGGSLVGVTVVKNGNELNAYIRSTEGKYDGKGLVKGNNLRIIDGQGKTILSIQKKGELYLPVWGELNPKLKPFGHHKFHRFSLQTEIEPWVASSRAGSGSALIWIGADKLLFSSGEITKYTIISNDKHSKVIQAEDKKFHENEHYEGDLILRIDQSARHGSFGIDSFRSKETYKKNNIGSSTQYSLFNWGLR